ncbi:MAG: hypothetical protein Kow0089_09250 [Desulfobulbaceae bacterium]
MKSFSGSFVKQVKIQTQHAFIIVAFLLPLLFSGCGNEAPPKLKVGDPAPPFSLVDLDGRKIRLDDFRGHPVLLRFFLTDCNYCRADTPVFNAFYDTYREKGLGVVYIDSLGLDTKVVQAFATELGIRFPVAQDREGKVSALYHVRALPQTIVLDPDHRIAAAILGGVSESELEKLLAPYFSQ